MNTLLRRPLPVLASFLLAILNPIAVSAGFEDLNALIETPADGGSGPAIWYQTAREPNLGSGAATLTLTSGSGSMTAQRPDFFGDPTGAFALAGTSGSAAVAGGAATDYLTGSQASLVITFKTPPSITANSAIFSRGDGSVGAGKAKFEVYLLGSDTLRLATGDTTFGVLTSIATLTEDTWYYLAVTWDLALPNNQVSWYLGKMGDATLSSGSVDNVSVVGNPASPIYVGGRSTFDIFSGSFQNIAIYDRPLSAQAIQDQFAEASLPLPHLLVDAEGPNTNYEFGTHFLADPITDTETRTMRFVNPLEEDVIVQEIALENDGGGAFSIGAAPETPFTLAAGATFDVGVALGGDVTGGRSLKGDLAVVSNLGTDPGGTPGSIHRETLSAVVWATGDAYLLHVNPSVDYDLNGWTAGGLHVAPGFGGSPRNVRVLGRNDGEPDSFGQVITGGATNFEMEFLVAIPDFQTAVGSSPDASLGDRSFQWILHSDGSIPVGAWTDTHAGSAMINLAYLPAGNGSSGEGFYLFDGTAWQLVSALGTLDSSVDADENGALNVGAGDTVSVYQLTLTGRDFSTPAAAYDISVSEVNSTDVAATATGLTISHASSIADFTPAAFTFTTSDRSHSSGNGPDELVWASSFWVDEVFFALPGALPVATLAVSQQPAEIRVWEGRSGATTFTLRNDGLGGADLDISAIEFSDPRFSLVSPSVPVSIAPGETEMEEETFTVSFDSTGIAGEDAVTAEDIIITSNNALRSPNILPVQALVFAPGNHIFGSFEVPGGDPETGTDTFAGWIEAGAPHLVTAVPGLIAGSTTAAYIGGSEVSTAHADNATVDTDFVTPVANFEAEVYFALQQSSVADAEKIRIEFRRGSVSAVLVRYKAGFWHVHSGGVWNPTLEMPLTESVDSDGNGSLDDAGDTKAVYRLKITGRDWDNDLEEFDLEVYESDGTLVGSTMNLKAFRTTQRGPLSHINLTARWESDPGFWIDEFVVTALPVTDFKITLFDFDAGVTPNTILRWTDIAQDYEVVATDELPFGVNDLVIAVTPENGILDTTTYPDEVEFSFDDPGATGARRFWRVRVQQP